MPGGWHWPGSRFERPGIARAIKQWNLNDGLDCGRLERRGPGRGRMMPRTWSNRGISAQVEAWIRGRKARASVLFNRKRASNGYLARPRVDRETGTKGVVFAAMRMGVEGGRDRGPGIDRVDRSAHSVIEFGSISRGGGPIDTVLIGMWRVDKGLLSGYDFSATLIIGAVAREYRGIARDRRGKWIDLARI
nr:hypothetical protein [Candidatus Sigynarchaeum springense]